MKIEVTYLDGRKETVKATAMVKTAVERKYNIDGFQVTRLEHLFFAAWTGMRQAQKETRDFESFLEVLDDAEFVEEFDVLDSLTSIVEAHRKGEPVAELIEAAAEQLGVEEEVDPTSPDH